MNLKAKRSLFALTMLLILFLSLSMVSASDMISDDLSSSDVSLASADAGLSLGDDFYDDVSLDDASINDDKASSKLGDSYLSDEADSGSEETQGNSSSEEPQEGSGSEETQEVKDTEIIYYADEIAIGDSAEIFISLESEENLISGEISVIINEDIENFTTITTSNETDTPLTLTGLQSGTNDVLLIFNGDDSYNPSIAQFSIVSYGKSSHIEYNLDERVIAGEDVPIRVYLKDGDGKLIVDSLSINVLDSNNNSVYSTSILITGTATIPGSSLTENEEYMVIFSYPGVNYTYAPYNDTAYFTVLEELDTCMEVNHDEQMVGDSTDAFITLYDENYNPIKGTVDIYINDEFYSSAPINWEYQAITLTGFEYGSNNVTVRYNGTKFYKGSEFTFNISRYDVQAILDIEASDVVIGKDAVITVNLTDSDGNLIDGEFDVIVSENYGGDDESYVPLKREYKFNGTGTITIESTDLNEGSEYNVYANYAGNLTHTPDTEIDSFKVVSRDTDLDIYAPISSDDEEISINVYLINAALERVEGTVALTIYDNESKVIDSYNITTYKEDIGINIGKFEAGHYTLNVKFDGNHFYNECEENQTLHVFKASEIKIDSKDVIIGNSETINFTLVLSDGALLNDTIFVNIQDFKGKKNYYSDFLNLTDGKASIEIPEITEDLLIYSYFNNGMDMYGPYKAEYMSATQYGVIKAVENTIPNATIDLSPDGDSIVASLKDLDSNPIANANINVDINGAQSNMTTDDKGQVTIADVPANSTVEVKYTDASNLTASSKALVVGQKKIKTQTDIQYQNMSCVTVVEKIDGRIGKYFQVNLTDINGNPLAGKKFQIGFHGKIYNRTTNATGGAQLQINLPQRGKYTFALCFLGDEDYEGCFAVAAINVSTQTPKLTASAKTYKVSATKTLTATFQTAQGHPVSGRSLVFIINGKLYNAKTNSNGVASIKVSISVRGTYTCTVSSTADDTYAAISKKFTVKIT